MDKNKKKQKNIGPIKRYMENKVKKNTLEAIKRFRNKYHEEPSAEQKRKIYINEQKKLMRENSCKQIFTKYLTEYYGTKINENQSLQNEGIEPGE